MNKTDIKFDTLLSYMLKNTVDHTVDPHMALIKGYVTLPSIYYSTYDLHWGLGNTAFWRGNGMWSKDIKKNISCFFIMSPMSCHAGYIL